MLDLREGERRIAGELMREAGLHSSLPIRHILTLVVFLFITNHASGHNGEYPPSPPRPPVAPGQLTVPHEVRVYPLRWSWVHWWEANRDRFLRTGWQGDEAQGVDEEQHAALRARTVAALRAALKDVEPVRSVAALALGRMQETDVLEALKERVEKDDSEEVRMRALLGMALLDQPESEAFFVGVSYPTLELRLTAVACLGMMEEVSGRTLRRVERLLDSEDPRLASVAAWVVREQAESGDSMSLQRILRTARSPWLASEALLAMGSLQDRRSLPLLRAVALGEKAASNQVRVFESLLEAHRRKVIAVARAKENYEAAWEFYRKAKEEWDKNNPNSPPMVERKPILEGGTLELGMELIYLARLRAAAVIALGRFEDPAAARTLVTLVEQRGNEMNSAIEYDALPKEMALLSLGEMGAIEGLEPMLRVLSPRTPGGAKKALADLESPLRGCAALALGLYARPVESEQGRADRPGFEHAIQALSERLADPEEQVEVRAASAVALGLVGRTSSLRVMQAVSERLGQDEEALIGYLLLGRGMLGDQNILRPAERFLAVTNERTDMEGILARRAAALGVGLLGVPPSIPILTEAWHLNHYVNREVAIALSFCRAQNVAEPLIGLLKNSEDPYERAYMAMALGELFTRERPPRLSEFLAHSNYPMKNEALMPYQTLANEFLYNYLIPATGETWR